MTTAPDPSPPPGPVLPDGRYDTLVIDAEPTAGGGLRIELTVIAGERKGDVVAVTAAGLDRDPLDVMGVPATLTVAGGRPVVAMEG